MPKPLPQPFRVWKPMLTTFDKYLLSRLLHTFLVFLIATYGLYIVIDLFSNVDDFQSAGDALGADSSSSARSLTVVLAIVRYYGIRAAEFFEMAGSILIAVSVIAVLGLLEKHSESHPILAAGIPAFRLLRPLLLGTALLNLLLIGNQELVMPRLAAELQTPRGGVAARAQRVEPVYDYPNFMMHIDGREIVIEERKLVDASFALPPELSHQVYTLKCEAAVFMPQTSEHSSGWLLKNLTGLFDVDMLTDEGRKRIFARSNGRDVFIVSDVSFDQLYNRVSNVKLLSTAQLVDRIRNPSTGPIPVVRQSMALHTRLTRPILSLLVVAMSLPLVMRRESQSLIWNMTICAGVLGGFYVLTQACYMLGGQDLLRPDFAAWLPVIVTGAATMWSSGYVQT
ncbi:MAG: LptF/LptG family permease [Planctomycetaceae bacterium]